MVKVDEKERIRRAYFLHRKSMRQIAREFHHARRTVRKAICDPAPPRYARVVPAPKPVLDPFTAIIDRWLDDDLSSPRKQRHTARRIYHRLLEEHGFKGGESTVRRYVRERRPREREVYLPLEYDPGSDAQCDFGSAYVVMGDKLEEVQLFCLRLCYSTKPLIMAFPHQKQEAFVEGHVAGFNFLDGVPANIWYDQLALAVRPLIKGRGLKEQEAFVAFRSHYLFQSRFCNPREAHEKGLVENLVGYARRNFLVPVPKVSSFQELNELLLERCLKEDQRRLRGKTKTIGELWLEEKARLLPLPKHAYPCCKVCTVKPNSLSLVHFETNRYSIPVTVAEDKLTLKAFVDRVEISAGEKIVGPAAPMDGKRTSLTLCTTCPFSGSELRRSLTPKPSAAGTGRKSLTATWVPCGSITRTGSPPGSSSGPWSSAPAILKRRLPGQWTRLLPGMR
jgi:transposase